jgi:monoamine oxidase
LGVKSVVFEANNLVGGRIRCIKPPNWPMPVELGAEFVHQRPAPTLALVGDAELVKVPDVRCEVGAAVRSMPNVWSRFATLLEPAREAPTSQSMHDYLESGPFADDSARLVRSMVNDYHAVGLDEVSARAIARDAASLHEFEQFRITGGQGLLLDTLVQSLQRANVPIQVGTLVRNIAWRPNDVTLQAIVGQETKTIRARRCLVTVSVGVLQAAAAGGINIEPYPPALRTHLNSLGMGNVVKLVLRFSQPQWPETSPVRDATFLHFPDATFKTLWHQQQDDFEQITAWVGGPAATALAEQHPALVMEEALIQVARLGNRSLSACRRDLLQIHHHDFVNDPTTRGAYSFVRPAGEQAARALSEPMEKTLFFAGEALDLEYPATVAGALASGTRAARKIAVSLA